MKGRRAPRLSTLDGLRLALGLAWLVEKAWKHRQVARFFRQPPPALPTDRALATVSIIQPILSGDPTLAEGLAANLRARSRYRREWLWLVDEDDAEGLRICRDLIARHPARAIRLLPTPPPTAGDRRNPKTVKLIAGAANARGDILCILDDDTRLPDDGLESCLPFLDRPGVGLAYGLPYYVSFADWWSSLVAAFVNSHSLLTYIPPLALTEPFTINGMFYAARREILDAIGGFAGLEAALADDFAVAQRFRAAGYRLAQTPLRHAISTRIAGPRHYFSLLQRWFVFPRESVLRHVGRRDRLIVALLAIAPTGLPLLLLLTTLVRPSRRAVAFVAGCHAAGYRLAQTPLRHAISTRIAGPHHYVSLIQRWFVFPRESVLRHVGRRDRLLVTLLAIAPICLPLLLLLATLVRPSRRALAFAACCHAASFATFAREDTAYLGGATPWRRRWLVPLVQTILPLQVGAALLLPQRITWRGHVLEVERGGGFRFVQRRGGGVKDETVRLR